MKQFLFFIVFIFSSLVAEDGYDPVSIYLTWTKSPESSMSVHWISPKADTENRLFYRLLEEENSPFQEVPSVNKQMPEGHPFLIHHVTLDQLKPNSSYLFKISGNGRLFKFKTMPENLNTPIRFVEGGDVYHGNMAIVEKMNRQAAKQNPSFAIIGGDIAYAADSSHGLFPEEFHRWMKWLTLWKNTMVTEEGFLIPILATLGNHETSGGFGKTPSSAPFFYALFRAPSNQSFQAIDFGNYMSLILLDSGHTQPISGKQTEWLESALKERVQMPYKFAIYHVPAYPSARKYHYEISQLVRSHWVPLFDAAELTAAFEHHDHTYKRTFPLKNGRPHEKGVLYLGDGAWGVEKPRVPKRHLPYLARVLSVSHFILVTLNPEAVTYEAINAKGDVIDRYVKKSQNNL
ncbi:MAG TPA: metallophosphoesterase family protein [Parachlamydiaceae bacterium]|nr:metallophosphoesterase family protein [Parachlamydiaceae bacterium]